MEIDRHFALRLAALACTLGALTACNRQEPPTPGVAGGSASPPAATGAASSTSPVAPDAQTGRGKSPGQDGSTPEGVSGQAGTAPMPSPAPAPAASSLPAIPPADAPGTGVPVPPASAASQ